MAGAGSSVAIPSNELLETALAHGFELIRESRHRIIKRGATRFALPLSGLANAYLSNQIIGICNQIDAEEQKRTGKLPEIPLQVLYRGAVYAVRDQDADRYQLLDLTSGQTFWCRKKECRPMSDEELAERAERMLPPVGTNGAAPPVAVEEMPAVEEQQTPEPAGLPIMRTVPETEVFGGSTMAGWVVSTTRAIERLQVEIEQKEASLLPMRNQLKALQTALDAIQGAPIVGQAPKRTILPPTGPGRPKRNSGRIGGGPVSGEGHGVRSTRYSSDQIERSYQAYQRGESNMDIAEKVLGDRGANQSVANWAQRGGWRRN